MVFDPEHRTRHFSNNASSSALLSSLVAFGQFPFNFLAEPGSFVWQQVPLWTRHPSVKNVNRTSFLMQVALKTSLEAT